jgi:hypothetical protein
MGGVRELSGASSISTRGCRRMARTSVDFDWSGHVGVVKHSPTLNTSGEVKWAKAEINRNMIWICFSKDHPWRISECSQVRGKIS